MGILSLLLWTPLLGGAILAMVPGQRLSIIRIVACLIAFVVFVMAVYVLLHFDSSNPMAQFTEHFEINAPLGDAYALGVDGISLPILVIGSFLVLVALIISKGITNSQKTYYISVLLLEFGMLGVFIAQDWVLFYIFWEATLVPLFFLIDRWGGRLRHSASLNFAVYTFGGSIFILVGLFALGEFVPPLNGTLMATFMEAAQKMPHEEQLLVFIAFLIGFGVKIPLFPLHGWLPLVHQEAPFTVSMLLSGILLTMGAYGVLKIVLMLPLAVQTLEPVLVGLALFGMLYGGVLAWRQSDLKAMAAYSSISQMSSVLLGIFTLNLTGMMGAVLQLSAQGLVAGSMFLLLGLLHQRTATLNIQDYSSLSTIMPRFSVLMTLALLGAMGLPGTLSFIAELHTIIGGFERWGGWMVFFSFSLLLTAAYAMRTVGLLFTGPVKPQMLNIVDLKTHEFFLGAILVGLLVFLGFIPSVVMNISEASLKHSITALEAQLKEAH